MSEAANDRPPGFTFKLAVTTERFDVHVTGLSPAKPDARDVPLDIRAAWDRICDVVAEELYALSPPGPNELSASARADLDACR